VYRINKGRKVRGKDRVDYTEMEEQMAQRIFEIGFVRKADFVIEDCRYIVNSFYDLIAYKFQARRIKMGEYKAEVNEKLVCLEELQTGDWFKTNGELCVKTDAGYVDIDGCSYSSILPNSIHTVLVAPVHIKIIVRGD